MRINRWAAIIVLIGVIATVIATLVALIISLVPNWFWMYKWWLLGGLGIIILSGAAMAMAYYVRERRLENASIHLWYRNFIQNELFAPPGTDPVVISHKATPKIAITSGLLAILSLSATMVLITNLSEATPGLTITYIAVALLGIASFGLGLLILRERSKALSSLRSEWQRLQEEYIGGPHRLPDQARRHIAGHLAEQRDTLLISGDLVDADRAAKIIRSLSQPAAHELDFRWHDPEVD